MANKQIHSYTAASTIDAAADYLLIDPASSGVYNSINRNTLLGLTSTPLGLTDTQSPTNKTFNNTNILTIKAANLTIQDGTDTTKQAVFSLSGITTGNTRTITLPDANFTAVGTTTTQTLTNKTLTSPTITGGSMDNTTVTVDSISGHTVSTTVTVANLQIANGVLNTANAVTATSVAAGAIQPQALVSGTGSGWAWSNWTPAWTNLTPGNGVLTFAKYVQIGKTVFARLYFTLGSTSSVSGDISFTLPVTANSGYADNYPLLGQGLINPAAAGYYPCYLAMAGTTTTKIRVSNATGTYVDYTACSATVPATWATNGTINVAFCYEAA